MKKIMLIFAMILSLHLNGAAGFRQYIPQASRQLVTRLQQPTQRFMATQTPKFACPTGRSTGFKNQ